MVTSTTRKRTEISPYPPGKMLSYVGPTLVYTQPFFSFGYNTQVTTSHGNKIGLLRSKSRDRFFSYNHEDIGGSFQTSRVDTRGGLIYIKVTNGPRPSTPWEDVDGWFGVWSNNLAATLSITPSSKGQMDAFGTQAIARSLPTNPLAGMGQFLGELRDLPRLPEIANWQTRIQNMRQQTKNFNFDKVSRSAADEYLNQVFGWVPLVSDLHKFFTVARNSAFHMRKYALGSNKVLRRTYHFPTIESTAVEYGGSWYLYPPLPTAIVAKAGILTKTDQVSTKRWMKAAFTYYLPPIYPDDNGFVQAINKAKQTEAYANRLFGLRLTPDLLYKLTPWSWAADWVTTAGDVVHNWSGFANDGLVLKYSYMMEEIQSNTIWTCNGLTLSDGRVINHTQAKRQTVKSRTVGTPYGFGLNSASFTAKQWGVIGALGISKQPLSINR